MRPAAVLTGTIMSIVVAGGVQAANEAGCGSLLRHEVTTLQGARQDLCAHQGKVLLMFGKSSVVGASANPVFQELIARSAEQPTWNFHKYLVDRTGDTVLSFRSDVAPDSVALTARIESMLAAKTVDKSGTR
jgi:hypothetical protein